MLSLQVEKFSTHEKFTHKICDYIYYSMAFICYLGFVVNDLDPWVLSQAVTCVVINELEAQARNQQGQWRRIK